MFSDVYHFSRLVHIPGICAVLWKMERRHLASLRTDLPGTEESGVGGVSRVDSPHVSLSRNDKNNTKPKLCYKGYENTRWKATFLKGRGLL